MPLDDGMGDNLGDDLGGAGTSSAPFVALTRTSAASNPGAPLIMYAGENAEGLQWVMTGIDITGYLSAVAMIEDYDTGVSVTGVADGAVTVVQVTAPALLQFTWATSGVTTPPAGNYHVRLRVTRSNGTVIDTNAYYLKILPA